MHSAVFAQYLHSAIKKVQLFCCKQWFAVNKVIEKKKMIIVMWMEIISSIILVKGLLRRIIYLVCLQIYLSWYTHQEICRHCRYPMWSLFVVERWELATLHHMFTNMPSSIHPSRWEYYLFGVVLHLIYKFNIKRWIVMFT